MSATGTPPSTELTRRPRRELEPGPARPVRLVTVPGSGYRSGP